MIDPTKKIYVIVESVRDVALASEHLFRIGYDTLGGYLHQGMASWENAALLLKTLGVWTAPELDEYKKIGILRFSMCGFRMNWKKTRAVSIGRNPSPSITAAVTAPRSQAVF